MKIALKGSITDVMEGGVALLIVGVLAFVAIFAINGTLKIAGLPHWSIE